MGKQLRGISHRASRSSEAIIAAARFEFEGTICPKMGSTPGTLPSLSLPLRESAYLLLNVMLTLE